MFTFKKFVVHQSRTAMKVGTDGVLLGAWAPLESKIPQRFLDVGTGTGLISLMLAQRFSNSLIDSIDIDEMSVEQATENIRNSIFAKQISVQCISLQYFHSVTPYDAIVCNPPFFVNSLHCPDSHRTAARHTDTLSFSDLLFHSSRLLLTSGSLSLILPFNEAQTFINMASDYSFYLQEVVLVHPLPDVPPKRLLMHFIKDNTPPFNSPRESHLTIELSRHNYTPEYIALTRDFYLNM